MPRRGDRRRRAPAPQPSRRTTLGRPRREAARAESEVNGSGSVVQRRISGSWHTTRTASRSVGSRRRSPSSPSRRLSDPGRTASPARRHRDPLSEGSSGARLRARRPAARRAGARADGRERRRVRASSRATEARRDDRDPDLVGEPLVDGRAEDDVRVVGARPARTTSAASLTSSSERSSPPVIESRIAARAVDLGLEQRRARARARRPRARGRRRRPCRCPAAPSRRRHDRAHVGEVEVDQARQRDQVARCPARPGAARRRRPGRRRPSTSTGRAPRAAGRSGSTISVSTSARERLDAARRPAPRGACPRTRTAW